MVSARNMVGGVEAELGRLWPVPQERGRNPRVRRVVAAFDSGYGAAQSMAVEALVAQLAGIPPDRRGFAVEGAAMCLALQDQLAGGGGRIEGLRRRLPAHDSLIHLGLGIALG